MAKVIRLLVGVFFFFSTCGGLFMIVGSDTMPGLAIGWLTVMLSAIGITTTGIWDRLAEQTSLAVTKPRIDSAGDVVPARAELQGTRAKLR